MNILHIMKDYKPTLGGSVVRNSSILENYSRIYNRDNIYLLNLEGKLYSSYAQIKGIKVYRVCNIVQLIFKAIQMIKVARIDIIHAHNFRCLFVAYIAKILSHSDIKLIFELHAMYNMNQLKKFISYNVIKKVDAVVVLANCAKNYLVESHSIPASKIHVIRNGCDIDYQDCSLKNKHSKNIIDYQLIDIIKNKQDRLLFAYVGSFYQWQGVNFIADNINAIIAASKNIELILIGNGPEYNYVNKKCLQSSYATNIILYPGVGRETLSIIMPYFDVMLIPRLKNISTDTAVPLKLVDAMMAGKCILAANDNGLLEILDDSNAMIFESGNIDDFIAKMQKLIEDGQLREMLGRHSAIDAQKKFVTWSESCNKLHQLYCGL